MREKIEDVPYLGNFEITDEVNEFFLRLTAAMKLRAADKLLFTLPNGTVLNIAFAKDNDK